MAQLDPILTDIEVVVFTQSFSQRMVSITLRETDVGRAMSALSRIFRDEMARSSVRLHTQEKVAAISIVGESLPGTSIVGRLLLGLGDANIKVLGMTELPTENSFSVLVRSEQYKKSTVHCSLSDD